jgi:hypothetical protein
MGQLQGYYPSFCGTAWMSLSFLFLNLGITSESLKKSAFLYFLFGFFALFAGFAHLNVLIILSAASFIHLLISKFSKEKISASIKIIVISLSGFITATIFLGLLNVWLGGDFLFFIRVLFLGVNYLVAYDYIYESVPYFYLQRTYLIFVLWAFVVALCCLIKKIISPKKAKLEFSDILQIDVIISCLIASVLVYKMANCLIDKDNAYSLYYLFWAYLALIFFIKPFFEKFDKNSQIFIAISYFVLMYICTWIPYCHNFIYNILNKLGSYNISLGYFKNVDYFFCITSILTFILALLATIILISFKKKYFITFPLFLLGLILVMNHAPFYMQYKRVPTSLSDNLKFVVDASKFINKICANLVVREDKIFFIPIVGKTHNDIISQPRLSMAFPEYNIRFNMDVLRKRIDEFKNEKYKLLVIATRHYNRDVAETESIFNDNGIYFERYANNVFYNNNCTYYFVIYKLYKDKINNTNIFNNTTSLDTLESTFYSEVKKHIEIDKEGNLFFSPETTRDHCATQWIDIEKLQSLYRDGKISVKMLFNRINSETFTIELQDENFNPILRKENILLDKEADFILPALGYNKIRLLIYGGKPNGNPIYLPHFIKIDYIGTKK